MIEPPAAKPAFPLSRRSTIARYDRLGPPPPPKPAGPPLFLVELGGKEMVYDHPIWIEHPNFIPSARVDVRYRHESDGIHYGRPAAGPADTTHGFMTTLFRLMDGFEKARPGRAFRWFGIPAVFGGEWKPTPNAIPLLNNPADRLKSGRRGPFFAEGARKNAAWSQEMLQHLAAELAFRKMPDPLAFILTTENGPQDDLQGHEGTPDKGWVPEALADPRARDPAHTIDGVRTFAEYMAQCRTLEGGPVPVYRDGLIGMPPGRNPRNDESTDAYRGALRLAWDWSREIAFAAIARAAFRRNPARPFETVKIGEFEAACDSPWSPVPVRPLTRLHSMDGLFHSDLQCPGWYGDASFRTNPDLEADSPGWETVSHWRRVYPQTERDPERMKQRLALDVHKGIATGHALSAPRAALAPFVGRVPGSHEGDMVEYLRHCRTLGMWAAIVFMPKVDRETLDFWQRVVPRVCA